MSEQSEQSEQGDVTVRPATEADLPVINRIYNGEVLNGTATWDEEPWSLERRSAWLRDRDDSMPALVAEIDGAVAGFAYLSHYRPKAGYRFTREDTVYVDPAFQRRGVGQRLLGALIDEARREGTRSLIAVIEAENAVSIRLHERFGFMTVGTAHQIGFKFGRWLDSTYMELVLGGSPG